MLFFCWPNGCTCCANCAARTTCDCSTLKSPTLQQILAMRTSSLPSGRLTPIYFSPSPITTSTQRQGENLLMSQLYLVHLFGSRDCDAVQLTVLGPGSPVDCRRGSNCFAAALGGSLSRVRSRVSLRLCVVASVCVWFERQPRALPHSHSVAYERDETQRRAG